MNHPADYDALLASTERDIEIATIGRKDGLVTHTVDQAQSLVDAIRALRAALQDAETSELKNALAVGQACIELIEERRANEALRAALAESEREVAVYRDWHDDVMAKCRANDFFDGYGNTMRLTPAMAAQEKAK